jgi:hypothetical protein
MDWDKIVACAMNGLSGYIRDVELYGSKCGAEPEEWSASHEPPVPKERPPEKEFHTPKRRVVDRDGKVVSEWMSSDLADFVACMSPVIAVAMIRSIESMSSIIAEYRNHNKLMDYATPESVARQMLAFHHKNVSGELYENAESAIRRHHKKQVKRSNEDHVKREAMLKKVFLESTDPVWLLTPEERLERGLRSRKNRHANGNGDRPRSKRRYFRGMHANRKRYYPKKNPDN